MSALDNKIGQFASHSFLYGAHYHCPIKLEMNSSSVAAAGVLMFVVQGVRGKKEKWKCSELSRKKKVTVAIMIKITIYTHIFQ